ncbi:MAG: lipopolysaccharide heptosyltransferase I [Pseudomonadales bacterium]
MRVLVVKMSSLGDVVHALPAVSDAHAALASRGIVFDWVVEEAFAAIPARHPAVATVLPIAWRRWRGDLIASRRALRAFTAQLRSRRYDLILDAQGLVKSAAVTLLARGDVRAGLARGSAREAAAALVYSRPIAVPREQHAVDRLRQLFAATLGYAVPASPPRFAIAPDFAGKASGAPRCVLLHGTTWASKLWPVSFWKAIITRATDAGFDVLVPWGSAEEQARAAQITAGTRARVLDRLPLAALLDELAGASLVIGVDSGLAHLAGALEVPTLVIYGSTSSALTGCRGSRVGNLQAEFPCAPCLARSCRYAGPQQHWQGEVVAPACYARVPPELVWQQALELLDADRVLHI